MLFYVSTSQVCAASHGKAECSEMGTCLNRPQEYFRLILLTVVGQAFGAAGYPLEERETQWAGGLFRFVKRV